MKNLFAVFLLIHALSSRAQTPDHWAQAVNWDGVSHWSRYMITLPAYQGPNSLPVPRLANGTIDSSASLSMTGNLHFSPGDNTQNIALYGSFCLLKDVVSVDISWIPYEHFNMSTAIKDKRHVYYEYFYDKSTVGDVYMNTNFRLFKKWSPVIDLIFQVGYRFPSGEDFGAARYSDGPGYYFNMNFGKPLNKDRSLKLTWMLGFYVWQIESDVFNQDDAFLFGAGLDWQKKSWRIQSNVCGYLGYLENQGDKPIVFRLRGEKRTGRMGVILGFQQGLHDFRYSSAEFGAAYYFKWPVATAK